ncbi:MAG: protein kinase [Ignavibacteriales bacterium]|nr:protein kinase [Ignavibacteriales bacterium]
MIGETISHYKIMEKLGEGGMGIVYKAQDTTLDRFVALKFLPSQLAASDEDKARFVQEAKAAASLSHPNVCTIFGVGEHEGPASAGTAAGKQIFIEMEFVEGQTLRVKGSAIPLKQAIEVGIQLADGLAAAHEKGIVHRDLKPENIMLQKDGRVRIMDFGLAKLKGVSRLTKAGSTVGTAGYMSPEQVQGLETDHRTDIFSLGVLLYELFAGESPFKGVHETAINYEIVNVDPSPISAAKPDVDPALDGIVLECLAKEPGERYQSVAEIAKELRRYKRESSRSRVSRVRPTQQMYVPVGSSREMPVQSSEPASAPPSVLRKNLLWIIAAVTLLLAAGSLVALFVIRSDSPAPIVARSYIHPPVKMNFNTDDGGHMAISPDGEMLAFVARDSSGKNLLWVRPLRTLIPTPLAGTEGAFYPFWSYDSRFVAFFVSGKLKKIDRAGGPALTICDAADGRGGDWNQAGVIVFSPGATTGLMKVASAGGVPTWVTQVDTVNKERGHRWPHFLPDGEHFLYVTRSSATGVTEEDAIYATSLGDTSMKKLIVHAASNMIFANGHLLYLRQETLLAHPFDESKIEFLREAVPVAEQVQYVPVRSKGIFSAARTGVLVYQSRSAQQERRMVWLDRAGREIKTINTGPTQFVARISRDGRRIALGITDTQADNVDIWLHEIARGVNTRFTFHKAVDVVPFFSPDGSSVVFSSNRDKNFKIYRKNSNGTEEEELLYDSPVGMFANDWSPDGRYLLLQQQSGGKTGWDLAILPLMGDRKPVMFLQSEFNEQFAQFSTDMRWISYHSDESGKLEVYVRPFLTSAGTIASSSAGKWQVSTNGGQGALWSRDGKRLFYASADRKLMSVEFQVKGGTFEVGTAEALFDLDTRGEGQVLDVMADGQMFLAQITAGGTTAPVTLVMNWNAELEQR